MYTYTLNLENRTYGSPLLYIQRARTVQLGYITTGLDMTLQYNIFTIWRLQAISGAKFTFYN